LFSVEIKQAKIVDFVVEFGEIIYDHSLKNHLRIFVVVRIAIALYKLEKIIVYAIVI